MGFNLKLRNSFQKSAVESPENALRNGFSADLPTGLAALENADQKPEGPEFAGIRLLPITETLSPYKRAVEPAQPFSPGRPGCGPGKGVASRSVPEIQRRGALSLNHDPLWNGFFTLGSCGDRSVTGCAPG
jgi:hypothetical protein